MKAKTLYFLIFVGFCQILFSQTYEFHNSLNFGNVNDGRDIPDGITWLQPEPLNYGIYRTPGSWSSPNYQQLKLAFETGIIIEGGYRYGRSGTFLQPNGGKVGVGTISPEALLHNAGDFQNNGNILLGHMGDTNYVTSREVEQILGIRGSREIRFGTYQGNWIERMVISNSGDLGIGTSVPNNSLTIRKSPAQFSSHIYFGEPTAIAGQPSATLCFGGSGIQNAGFTWVPNNTDSGKLLLSFGGYDNGFYNATKMTFQSNGNIGIGTLNPSNKLDVNGTIHSKEVKVDMTGWSDFVFKKEYYLAPLEQVEKHIAEKGHLENIPSEEEVLRNGISLGKMNTRLLQKIEELTLYTIDQHKQNKRQFDEIGKLKDQIDSLRNQNEALNSILGRLSVLEQKQKQK